MSDESQGDPFAHMVKLYDTWSKAWAQAMSEAVSSKSFAESMGQQIEGSLEALSLVRKQTNDIMAQYLRQMNLPTRDEVISLATRLTKVEMAIDDIDAKLDQVLDLLKAKE
jgi:hypothetical protein